MTLYLYIPIFLTLVLMSLSDLKSREIPHSLTLILLGLGITHGIINEQFIYINWIVFVATSIFLIFTFYILDKLNRPIGGGDIKMLCISMLFLSTPQEYMTYLLAMIGFNIICFIISFAQNETSGIKYGPYLSLALLTPMTLFFVVDLGLCIFIISSLLLFFIVVQTHYHLQEVIENVEIFNKQEG